MKHFHHPRSFSPDFSCVWIHEFLELALPLNLKIKTYSRELMDMPMQCVSFCHCTERSQFCPPESQRAHHGFLWFFTKLRAAKNIKVIREVCPWPPSDPNTNPSSRLSPAGKVLTWGVNSLIVPREVLEPGNPRGRRCAADPCGRGRSCSCLAEGSPVVATLYPKRSSR